MTTTTNDSHIDDVRALLMTTLRELTSRDKPMQVDRAKAVAQVASVLVDTARVEVDYLRISGQKSSSYLSRQAQTLPDRGNKQIATGTVDRTPGRTIHIMGD